MPDTVRFTALPVKIGDAFLLEVEGKILLIDGGNNPGHLVELLTHKLPRKHIDILICTHYDTDHYKGVLGVIKSNTFTISEIWLPEVLGSIGYSIKKDYRTGLEVLRSLADFNPSPGDMEGIINRKIDREEYAEGKVGEEEFSAVMLSEKPWPNYYNYNYRWYTDAPLSEDQQNILTKFATVPSIIKEMHDTGSLLRWFSYKERNTQSSISNCQVSLFSMNCIQTHIQYIRNPSAILLSLYAITLSGINRFSLNFMYDHASQPQVLFTADSDLSYRTSVIHLKDGSLVTAPHHGASSAESAYGYIRGNNISFVRSDTCTDRRPCTTYKQLAQKYCTVCQNQTIKSEVIFTYNEGDDKISTKHKNCICI